MQKRRPIRRLCRSKLGRRWTVESGAILNYPAEKKPCDLILNFSVEKTRDLIFIFSEEKNSAI
jgi:hypothetical protein